MKIKIVRQRQGGSMATEAQAAPAESPQQKQNDKEFNFRQLEAKYAKDLQKEREYRAELEQKVNALSQQQSQSEIQKAMAMAKASAKDELKQEFWLENNPDFFDILQHADKFAESNPALADSILKMPDTFERKKLVYSNIKALGLHKPKTQEPSIQDKIDANRRSPYYQPSGIAAGPYTQVGDFTDQGKAQAYKKMQELKSKLRLG